MSDMLNAEGPATGTRRLDRNSPSIGDADSLILGSRSYDATREFLARTDLPHFHIRSKQRPDPVIALSKAVPNSEAEAENAASACELSEVDRGEQAPPPASSRYVIRNLPANSHFCFAVTPAMLPTHHGAHKLDRYRTQDRPRTGLDLEAENEGCHLYPSRLLIPNRQQMSIQRRKLHHHDRRRSQHPSRFPCQHHRGMVLPVQGRHDAESGG